MKKIVITGSSGFIGTYLISKLAKLDFEVLCIYYKNKPISLKSKNIKFKKINLYNKYENWFEKLNKPDYLIHLAWNKLDNYKDTFHINSLLKYQTIFLENLINNGLITYLYLVLVLSMVKLKVCYLLVTTNMEVM